MQNPEPRKVHIAEVRKTHNGVTYSSVYLRRTFREDGKVKHETLGNLSDLPRDLIACMKRRLERRISSFRRFLLHGRVASMILLWR